MSEYNAVNYTEPGGAVTHIGGTLIMEAASELFVDENCFVTDLNGGMAEHQDASTATTVAALKDDFNALLSKLISAGLMKQEETQVK